MVAEGVSLGQVHETEITLRKAGATPDFWTRIAQNEELARSVVELVNCKPSCKVSIDCGQSLAEMISAGKYDWKNEHITAEHFPVKGKGKKEIEITLFHFGRKITSKPVIVEIDKEGYRPAIIEELLALGSTYPELQEQFPIVALGSVWRISDGHRILFIDWRDSVRRLGIYWFEDDFYERCRFAAVRK